MYILLFPSYFLFLIIFVSWKLIHLVLPHCGLNEAYFLSYFLTLYLKTTQAKIPYIHLLCQPPLVGDVCWCRLEPLICLTFLQCVLSNVSSNCLFKNYHIFTCGVGLLSLVGGVCWCRAASPSPNRGRTLPSRHLASSNPHLATAPLPHLSKTGVF